MSDIKLSPHFSLAELTVSQTATRKGIDNAPNGAVKANLTFLCNELLEKIRTGIGKPLHITSGYRSTALNKSIGGSTTSAHVYGLAADISSPSFGTPRQLATFIVAMLKKDNIKFDQVILEFDNWVHVGVKSPKGLQRGQVLTAKKIAGKTTYLAGLV